MIIVSQDRDTVQFDYYELYVRKTPEAHTHTYEVGGTVAERFVVFGVYATESIAKDVLQQIVAAMVAGQKIFYMPRGSSLVSIMPITPTEPLTPCRNTFPEFTCNTKGE